MFSDADAAALYDLLNPWDPALWPGGRFYHELVMAADSVLDVGCGTGGMLACAREHGHRGRLAGLDPDRAALERARRRADVEWVEGAAADARWEACFDLATMTGHAFQCLVTDHDLRASLAAIHAALREGGRFVFETRHPQARAWQDWNPSNASDVTDAAGRALRVWHEVESVAGEVVTVTETTAGPGGTVFRVDRASLRFHGTSLVAQARVVPFRYRSACVGHDPIATRRSRHLGQHTAARVRHAHAGHQGLSSPIAAPWRSRRSIICRLRAETSRPGELRRMAG